MKYFFLFLLIFCTGFPILASENPEKENVLVAVFCEGIAPQTTETNELLPKTTAPAGTVFHFADHLGSSALDTDTNGNVVSKTEYFPFGETRAENGNFENPYKYTGKELDEESGMYYYKARYYDPLLKRFASVDPITLTKDRILDPQSLNYFSYVRNNPMKFVDPSGEKTEVFLRMSAKNKADDFGHAMIKIDDTIYGFNRGKTEAYGSIQKEKAWERLGFDASKNNDSIYLGFRLDVTQEEENKIKEHLDYWNLNNNGLYNGGNYPPKYDAISNNCTDYLEDEILNNKLGMNIESLTPNTPQKLAVSLFEKNIRGDSRIKSVYGGYQNESGFHYVQEDNNSSSLRSVLSGGKFLEFINKIEKEKSEKKPL